MFRLTGHVFTSPTSARKRRDIEDGEAEDDHDNANDTVINAVLSLMMMMMMTMMMMIPTSYQ